MTKVEVDVPVTPEMIAAAFAEMHSDEQAKVLSMMWSCLRAACGGQMGAEIQCHYITEDLDHEALELLANLRSGPAEFQEKLVDCISARRDAEEFPPCPECGGSGEVLLLHSTVPCSRCKP